MQIDASEGTLTLNAPDRAGAYRVFRPGDRISLDWYRRTHGEAGNQGVGRVRLVEQPPAPATPSIVAATNPFATFYGADRELPGAAIDRMFGPAGGTPVLASDFERLARQALGTRGHGWTVRVWTYAERALISTALWPFDGVSGADDGEAQRVASVLESAGPETLLVVVGPGDDVLSDADLDWARRTVRSAIRKVSARLPVVRDAIVTRLWPLLLEHNGVDGLEAVDLPRFDLTGIGGRLRDREGRVSSTWPSAALLLNAAIIRTQARDEEGY